jgi:hypothetical protein
MTITLYIEATPSATLTPTAPTQQVQAPSAGFTGYVAVFA